MARDQTKLHQGAVNLTNGEAGRKAAAELGDSLGRLLLRGGVSRVDPAVVAERERISVLHLEALGEAGRIEWGENGLRILLRAADSPQRQRFTLAHELAHHFIFGVSPERSRDYSEEEERRCDRFAASMLMPKGAFAEAYQGLTRLPRSMAVCELADRFDVSLHSAMIRTEQLRLMDSAALLLLLTRSSGNEYRVRSAVSSPSVYYSLKGKTARELGLHSAIERALSMRSASRRLLVSARLPTKGPGRSPDFQNIMPSVMTCIALGPQQAEGDQLLVDLDPAVDPMTQRLRSSATLLQADLLPRG